MRLARLQLWMGRGADAALTLRRGVQLYRDDIEMNGLLLLCLVEQKSSRYLIHEARSNVRRIREQFPHVQLLKAAEARCAHFLGESDFGKAALQECALSDPALFDSVLAYSELLISEERFNDALIHLRRALQVSAHHPRVLNLLARAYLADTPSFNPEYATQLAISACQNTAWLSVRDLLCLAECYRVSGDKLAALVTAQRAKGLGVDVRIEHQQGELLQRLIAKIEHELQV
jgi:tetratricopeptide (TPR) repeat protein